ncbi:MAG: squalene--hopene cyclase [Deltaproteobacteria bacterium]|nr:squalene--hopene cyclase [Deltaproteobacteria bacterium]
MAIAQQIKVNLSAHPEHLKLMEHLQQLLWHRQEADGHWHFGLDDNITMNAEYILFYRWLNIKDEIFVKRLANHILNTQNPDGSWGIYFGGPGNLSASVEAYFALKAAGFSASDSRMLQAKDFITSQGGIPASRVFTKIWLALFGLFPWEGVPVIPPEILLAPRGMPFNIYEFSYWSRATIIPLTILFHLQKMRRVSFNLDELYAKPEDKLNIAFSAPPPVDDSWILKSKKWDFEWINWEQVFVGLNKGVTVYESKIPIKPLRAYCLQRAKHWILDHQEERGDWGGIQPPMMNSIMALHAMGMKLDEEPIQKGFAALKRFTRGVSESIRSHRHENADVAVLQSCVSPIWDTALGALALLEGGADPKDPRLQKTKKFLWDHRIQRKSDWAVKAKLKRGKPFAAWCFQYDNSHYPDVDDSAVVALVLNKLGMSARELEPAIHWIQAMQNTDGGWGTFDRDNNQAILNRIPFADLKSLIDPSNPDVTGHVLETFGELGLSHSPHVKKAIRFLNQVQKPDGSWFGRWGVNFIYGTTAAIVGLRKVGESENSPMIKRALKFLLSKQNADGGWGETCASYNLNAVHGEGASTPSQTAWALMSLAACRNHSEDFASEISRAIDFLNSRRANDGLSEQEFTGTGFPQHFYLRYDGYRNYFPLIALSRLKPL